MRLFFVLIRRVSGTFVVSVLRPVAFPNGDGKVKNAIFFTCFIALRVWLGSEEEQAKLRGETLTWFSFCSIFAALCAFFPPLFFRFSLR